MLMKDSLSGNCITHLIVCVAESSEMNLETISTLRFGLTCGSIKSDVKQNTAVDLGKKVSNLKNSIEAISQQIEKLEKQGEGGGFNMEEPKCTRDAYISNLRKVEICRKQLYDLQIKGTNNDVNRE